MTNSSPVQDASVDEAEESVPGEKSLLQLEGFLPHRLNVLSSLVSQALTQVYDKYGIGIPEWRVLVTLGQFGVMTGKAVGAHTHMHKTKVSRAVAQLEARKFVTRKANRAERRARMASISSITRFIAVIVSASGSSVVMSTPASLSRSIGYFDPPAERNVR